MSAVDVRLWRIVGDKVLGGTDARSCRIDLLDKPTDLLHVLYTYDKERVDHRLHATLPRAGTNSRIVNTGSRCPGTVKGQNDWAGISRRSSWNRSGVIAVLDGVRSSPATMFWAWSLSPSPKRISERSASAGCSPVVPPGRLFEAGGNVAELEISKSSEVGLQPTAGVIDLVGDKLGVLNSEEIGIRLYDEQATSCTTYEFEHGERLTVPAEAQPALPRVQRTAYRSLAADVFGEYDVRPCRAPKSRRHCSMPIIAGDRVINDRDRRL
jgi:hypothetical protein